MQASAQQGYNGWQLPRRLGLILNLAVQGAALTGDNTTTRAKLLLRRE
jgi:hypothetical protein